MRNKKKNIKNKQKTIPLSILHKKTKTLNKPKIKFEIRELLFKDLIMTINDNKIGISLKCILSVLYKL